MSNDLENNKIISAILVAGIVACLAGFVAKKVVHPEPLEKSVLDIDTSALEAASSGGAAPAGPEPILALLATADVAKGEALAKACLACHDFSKGGPNKTGPNLYGIVNNKKAHKEDFAYSDVIKEMAAKGDHWTYQNLSAFLWKPAAYAKGTKMSFPGLKKPQDRANIIAYLRSLADSPAPLPTAAEIAAEAPKETAAPADAKAADVKRGDTAASTAAKDAKPGAAAEPKETEKKDSATGPKGVAPTDTDKQIKPAAEDHGATEAPASAEKK